LPVAQAKAPLRVDRAGLWTSNSGIS